MTGVGLAIGGEHKGIYDPRRSRVGSDNRYDFGGPDGTIVVAGDDAVGYGESRAAFGRDRGPVVDGRPAVALSRTSH